MSYRDKNALPQEPGAKAAAGTTNKVKKFPRSTFRASVGHGSAAGGNPVAGAAPGTLDGPGATGDPTITYKNALTWARILGRTGKFGTQTHMGKQPINYDEDLNSYLDEY